MFIYYVNKSITFKKHLACPKAGMVRTNWYFLWNGAKKPVYMFKGRIIITIIIALLH